MSFAQTKSHTPINYRAEIKRADGMSVIFNVTEYIDGNKISWTIKNANERLKIDQIELKEDSLLVEMPFFESSFRLKKTIQGYEGQWLKATTKGVSAMPISLTKGNKRIILPAAKSVKNISGKWKAHFMESNGTISVCVAEFSQKGQNITGTILTPLGDYRYLEGSISGDSLALSTFDGSHAFLFTAHVAADGKLDNGVFTSGPTFKQAWNAIKDSNAKFNEDEAIMRPKSALSKLSFRFPDLDSNMVGIKDDTYKGKVVIIQIMGSWCPNCMDETAFLSRFYDSYKNKGLEVIGLAYEYSTDFARSRNSLMKFHDRLKVGYPFLITGVTTADTLRTEKTLPEMTPIIAFPSMIILGKDGTIRKTHAGYTGPATGIHYDSFRKEFTELIDKLLKEN
jgi:thiol-disulfide isomerase/thioredoxin